SSTCPLDDKSGCSMIAFAAIRDRHHNISIGICAMSGEILRTVDDPLAFLFDCSSAHACGIRTGTRLGERPCAEVLALSKWHYIFLDLLFGAELKDMIGAKRIVSRYAERDRTVYARQFFNDRGIGYIAHTSAADFFGEED